jgi:uncharacterized membrane protein
MTTDIAYALAALVCYGLADFIYKRAAAAGLAAERLLMGQAWFFCPAIVVYAWATGTLQFRLPALWGALAGLLNLLGLYCFSRSLRTGSVSLVAPVFRLNFVITAALAIGWLHEPLTAYKVAGFVLSLLAGWLLLGGSSPARASGSTAGSASFVLVGISILAAGAASFCHKLGLVAGISPETMLTAQAVVFFILATLLTYLKHGTIRQPAGFAKHSLPAAVFLLGAFLFLLHGMQHGDASLVVPIAQMGFVVTAILGVVFFKEGWTVRKVAGLGAAALALIVLAMG